MLDLGSRHGMMEEGWPKGRKYACSVATSLGLEAGGDSEDNGWFLSLGLEEGGDECPEVAREDACERCTPPTDILTVLPFGGTACEGTAGVVPRSIEHEESRDRSLRDDGREDAWDLTRGEGTGEDPKDSAAVVEAAG